VDLNKLTTGDKVIGISAVALLIFSFLPWYGKDFGNGVIHASYSRNGWSYFFFGVIPILLVVALVVLIGLQRFSDVQLPDLPISWEQAYAIAAGIAGVLILLKLLIGDKVGGLVDLDRKYGLFLAVLAAIGLVVGGFLNMKEAPTTGDDAPPPPPSTPPAV